MFGGLNMKKILLSAVIVSLLIGCAGVRPVLKYDRDQCLQDIVYKPLGIDVKNTRYHPIQEIRNRFGRPDSVQDQNDAYFGKTVTYFYKNKILTFKVMDTSSCLTFIDVIGGKVGCLKIGMSKDDFEAEYGSTMVEGMTGLEIRNYSLEEGEIQFRLMLEFKDNKLIRVSSSWDETFGLGSL
jgi:hypothetical protein